MIVINSIEIYNSTTTYDNFTSDINRRYEYVMQITKNISEYQQSIMKYGII